MEQRRFSGKGHWYHETQSSTGQTPALPLVPEAATVNDRFLLDLPLPDEIVEACESWLRPARNLCTRLFPQQVAVSRLRTFTAYDRLSTALTVAQVYGVQRLCNHYAARLAPLNGPDPSRESNRRLAQITQYARQLASSPEVIDNRARQQLDEVGLTCEDIILMDQIIGFIGFQARVIAAFQALEGLPVRWLPGMEMQAWAAPEPFSAPPKDWTPAFSGVEPRRASTSQLAAQAQWQTLPELAALASLLAHEQGVLDELGAILQSDLRATLPPALTQQVAQLTARINGSVDCFYAHPQTPGDAARFTALQDGEQAVSGWSQHDAQTRAVVVAVQLLTRAADRFSAAQFNPLIEQGFSVQQALSLLAWSGLCGWLNRLKIALGERQ
ncbi:CMD domain-containing protein [Enterobacter sp. ENT03]|uniref:CMD domain-containing protein n=1 Tax=Enterobacter sp. ENT03 TaxID=2854780 RepID=UPI001C4588D0|nr:CMD domain-containing protein [Enterobacter sp. ENT03]MBV7406119.1 CMD domain-containing protein [Enterobacter sp. ENT03]